MKLKRGQALIEAIAALGLSIMFLTGCLKLWMTAVEDLKADSRLRQKQICKMAGTARCSSDGGFVLVTMLMQLVLLVFCCHVLIAVFISEEFKWKITSWCFENQIEAVTDKPSTTSAKIFKIESEMNALTPGLIQFSTIAEGPLKTEDQARGLTESFYKIRWRTHVKFTESFFKAAELHNQIKCGARKLCHENKCTYSVIADKS